MRKAWVARSLFHGIWQTTMSQQVTLCSTSLIMGAHIMTRTNRGAIATAERTISRRAAHGVLPIPHAGIIRMIGPSWRTTPRQNTIGTPTNTASGTRNGKIGYARTMTTIAIMNSMNIGSTASTIRIVTSGSVQMTWASLRTMSSQMETKLETKARSCSETTSAHFQSIGTTIASPWRGETTRSWTLASERS